MYNFFCEYCNETFLFEKRTQPGAHKRNCVKNPNREKILTKIKNSNPNLKEKKVLNCKKCKKEYEILATNNNLLKGKYKKYCSLTCANSREWTTEKKEKVSNKIKEFNKLNGKILIREKRKCPNCDIDFECTSSSPKRYCSLKCAGSIGGRNSLQGKRSKNEIYFYELCLEFFKNVSSNEPIFNGWDADVILKNEKIAVLWNGVWHYKKITKNHSVKQVQNRDKLKINEIKKMGYTPYVIKDMGSVDLKFVESEFSSFKKFVKNILAR
jgi:hypothetical protein